MSAEIGSERRIQFCVWHWNSICSEEEEDGWRGLAWDHVRSWPWQWWGNPVAGVPCPGLALPSCHCHHIASVCQVPVSVREGTPETPETVRTQISSVPWSHNTPQHTDMEQTFRHFMSQYYHWLSNVARNLGTFSNWQTFDGLQILNFNGWSAFSTTLKVSYRQHEKKWKVFCKVSNIELLDTLLYLSYPVTSFHFHACYMVI